jgi:hypothetical protein
MQTEALLSTARIVANTSALFNSSSNTYTASTAASAAAAAAAAAATSGSSSSFGFNGNHPSEESRWIELDVTEAVNRALASGKRRLSLSVFTRTAALALHPPQYGDEIHFASREYTDSSKRPHLRITPSGEVNMALGRPTIQSDHVQAKSNFAVDGVWQYWPPSSQANLNYFSLTSPGQPMADSAWWQVDLGKIVNIGRVIVHSRVQAGSSSERTKFWIFIGATTMSAADRPIERDYGGLASLEAAKESAALKKLFRAARLSAADNTQGVAATQPHEWILDDMQDASGAWSKGRVLPGTGVQRCPGGSERGCCDADGSCSDGDDDWCCDGEYYCSNNGAGGLSTRYIYRTTYIAPRLYI